MTTTFQPPLSIPIAGGAHGEAPILSQPVANGRAIAAALSLHRHAVAMRLLESVGNWSKFASDLTGDLDAYLQREFYAQVDYLALYFRTGDQTYRDLYVGEKIKQAYHEPESALQQQLARRGEIAESDRQKLADLLRGKLADCDIEHLERELKQIAGLLTGRARHTPDVLFIGDCLFLDVMAFLPGATAAEEIAVNPTFLSSKNPAELRKQLRQMADRKFDLICYSPFTYEFSPQYSRLMDWRQAAAPARKIRELADDAMTNVTSMLDLLDDLFECSIFVHNSSNIRRHDASFAERAKCLATHRVRRLARQRVNERLGEYVARKNASGFDHLFVLDETTLLKHGELELGRMFYDSDRQHPAVLGKWVAQEYRDILSVQCQLLQRKLIVCDLDNTLWNGVIGEGKVAHHLDRQTILKVLKAKGVVLAINSKNDPKNVHWTGGVLCADDFVGSQINWNSKVTNVKRIAEALNLKTKDFVFIDDRADEREMVKLAIPEVRTLDANDPRTWNLLSAWERQLPNPARSGEIDRTQFYKQKEVRDSFLQTAVEEDQGAVFQKLQITVAVREAAKSDIKRIVELINRTNQFNTCGSRTSVREMGDWLSSGQRRALVIDAGDKFGSMGTVSVIVIEPGADRIEIPIFVLSCRVFGYGIENVAVNAVKRLAALKGIPVSAPFRQTAHNEPCRKVYPENGFKWDGSNWICAPDGADCDPAWLSVKFEDPRLARQANPARSTEAPSSRPPLPAPQAAASAS